MHKKNEAIMNAVALFLKSEYHTTIKEAKPEQVHYALSRTLMTQIADRWQESAEKHQKARHAYYFSAEFLIGRAIQNNMLSLGLTSDIHDMLRFAVPAKHHQVPPAGIRQDLHQPLVAVTFGTFQPSVPHCQDFTILCSCLQCLTRSFPLVNTVIKPEKI